MEFPRAVVVASARVFSNSWDHRSLDIEIDIEIRLLYKLLYFLALHLAKPGAFGLILTELAVTALCSPPSTPPPTIKISS
jgi:hypothetical protein